MKGFHFPSTRTTNSIRLILGSPYQHQTSPSALRGRYQSDPPESQIWHTDEAGTSLACYQSTLISGTSFLSQWYFPSSGRSTNEILWEIVASSPFLGPSRLCRSLARVFVRLTSLAQSGELARRLRCPSDCSRVKWSAPNMTTTIMFSRQNDAGLRARTT